jgi:disulfide oxidoreductase YuzD
MKKWTETELKRAMEEVKASFRVEGIELTEEHDKLVLERFTGKISHEEFIQRAKDAARRVQ